MINDPINTLIIAPWGNPFSWRRTTYLLDDLREEGVVTSIVAVIRKYAEKLKEHSLRVLLIVPETIMCPGRKTTMNSQNAYTRYTDYGKTLIDVLEFINVPDVVTGIDYKGYIYAELMKVIEKFVYNEVCSKIGISKIKCERLVRIVPAPNIGKYACGDKKVKWTLSEDISSRNIDISSYYGGLLLLEGVRYILDEVRPPTLDCCRKEEINIVLDVTHGINYMPLITYRAMTYMTRLIAALTGIKTRIVLYNSEPYTTQAKELRIYKVEEELFTSNRAIQRLVYSYASYNGGLTPTKIIITSKKYADKVSEILRKINKLTIGKYLEKNKNIVEGFAASIHYSLPLALLTIEYWDTYDLDKTMSIYKDFIDRVLRYLPMVKIHYDENDSIYMEYIMALNYDPAKTVLSVLGFKAYATRIYSDYLGSNNVNFIKDQKLYVDVNVLARILKDKLKGTHQLTSMHEIDNLFHLSTIKELRNARNKRINELVEKSYYSYICGREICEEKPCNPGEKNGNETRNFVAHAGLLSNLVCVNWKKNTIMIAYRSECKDVIIKLLSSSIKELRKIFR